MDEVISVILPTYNRAHFLDQAIGSVFSQSFQDWRLYVVDDASTDETLECVRRWQAKSEKMTFLQMPINRGVSAARNLGIRESKGHFISFLDSDDKWLPEKLEAQIQYFQKNSDCRIVHGEEIWVRDGVRVNPMKKHKKRGGWVFEDCLKLCCISPSTVMLKRGLLDEVGLFREDFPACEDYDLWLRICSKESVGFIEDHLIIKYGGHDDQLSQKFTAMDYWRILSIESLLTSGSLNSEWQALAKRQLSQKKSILLKGYRKHENLSHFDSIFSL